MDSYMEVRLRVQAQGTWEKNCSEVKEVHFCDLFAENNRIGGMKENMGLGVNAMKGVMRTFEERRKIVWITGGHLTIKRKFVWISTWKRVKVLVCLVRG